MKVLLINPPILKEYMRFPESPLGIAYLAATIRNGHEVKILDLNMDPHTPEKLAKNIKEFNPDMVGVSSATPAFTYMADLTETIKKEFSVPVIFGGNHVTALPEESLTHPGIDFVMEGEGDISFSRFLEEYDPGRDDYDVPGLGYKTKDGEVRVNPPGPLIDPLDNLPYAAWDLLPMKKYRSRFRYFVNFMLARGCPYNCVYCSSHLIHGKKPRRRSIDHIMGELRLLQDEHNITFVALWDDVLTLNREFIMSFCERKLSEGLLMQLWCNTRVDKVDPELLKMMKRAGFDFISYGIETGSQSTLDLIKKGTTFDQVKSAIEWTRAEGIIPHGYLMINFLNETEEDIKKTINLGFELNLPFFDLWSAIPYPGSKYESMCREAGLMPERNPNDFTNYWFAEDIMENGIVPAETVKKLMAEARTKMIFRPIFVYHLLSFFLRGARPIPADLVYYGGLAVKVSVEILKSWIK
jgi:radical SAM superfamily enzyme YgiQ (UPF0313 family)